MVKKMHDGIECDIKMIESDIKLLEDLTHKFLDELIANNLRYNSIIHLSQFAWSAIDNIKSGKVINDIVKDEK